MPYLSELLLNTVCDLNRSCNYTRAKVWVCSKYSKGLLSSAKSHDPAWDNFNRYDVLETKEQLMGNDITQVIFSWRGDPLAKTRSIGLVGNLRQIKVVLLLIRLPILFLVRSIFVFRIGDFPTLTCPYPLVLFAGGSQDHDFSAYGRTGR